MFLHTALLTRILSIIIFIVIPSIPKALKVSVVFPAYCFPQHYILPYIDIIYIYIYIIRLNYSRWSINRLINTLAFGAI